MDGLQYLLYALKRVLAVVIVVLLIATAIFQVFFVQSDPASTMIPKGGSEALKQAVFDDLKLGEPLPSQYINFMMKVLSGKFFISPSIWRGMPTSERIYDYTLTTVLLFAAVLVPSVVIGRTIAWLSAKKDDSRIWWRLVRLVSLGLGSAAIISASLVVLSLISRSGSVPLHHSFIGPWLTAFPIALGTFILIMRGRQKHFETGLTKAQSERPTSTNPMTKLFVAWVMVNVIAVEVMFDVAGLGELLWSSVLARDAPVLMACVFLLAVIIALANFALDLASPFVKNWLGRRKEAQAGRKSSWLLNLDGKAAQDKGAVSPVAEVPTSSMIRDFVYHPLGLVAIAILLGFVALAALAPALVTVDHPNDIASREPNFMPGQLNPLPPTLDKSIYTGFVHPLGTDHAGRDVYSELLLGTADPLIIVGILMGVSIGAGLLFWLLAAAASMLPRSARTVVGGISSVASDFIIALPAFLVIVMQLFAQRSVPAGSYPYYYALLVIAPLVVFACSFKAARVRMPMIHRFAKGEETTGKGLSGVATVMSKSAGTILFVAKFVVLFGFLTMFVAGFFVPISGPFYTSWTWLTVNAFDFSAVSSGAWWTYLPQLILSMLLIGASYKLLDSLEKVFVRRFGTLGSPPRTPPV